MRAAHRSRPTRSSGCSGWTGRATCASCATPSSGCSFCRRARASARRRRRLVGRRDAGQRELGSLLECRTFEEFKDAAERAFLLAKLREFDWNVSETARALEMPRSNLYKKIERYAPDPRDGQEVLMSGSRLGQRDDEDRPQLESHLGRGSCLPRRRRRPLPQARARRRSHEQRAAATSTLGVMARLVLAVALGVGCSSGPTTHAAASRSRATSRCRRGDWRGRLDSVWTWRHRPARHVLSLLLIALGRGARRPSRSCRAPATRSPMRTSGDVDVLSEPARREG